MLSTTPIRERLAEAPFTPFEFRLSDGRRIAVRHPDFIAVGGNVALVTDVDDHVRRIDVLHVVSLDDLPARRRNGKSGR